MFYPYEENEINSKIQYMVQLSAAARTEYLSALRMMMWHMHHLVIYKKVQRFYVLFTEKHRKTRMLMYV